MDSSEQPPWPIRVLGSSEQHKGVHVGFATSQMRSMRSLIKIGAIFVAYWHFLWIFRLFSLSIGVVSLQHIGCYCSRFEYLESCKQSCYSYIYRIYHAAVVDPCIMQSLTQNPPLTYRSTWRMRSRNAFQNGLSRLRLPFWTRSFSLNWNLGV
jgi:hypothetical protein